MADRLRIAPRHRRILEALLREHLPGIEVWAYGSRVNGRGHDGSDLDLVLRTPDLQRLAADQLCGFEDAVRESTIPFLVEIHDWAHLPERFHREIERDYVVMSESPAPGTDWAPREAETQIAARRRRALQRPSGILDAKRHRRRGVMRMCIERRSSPRSRPTTAWNGPCCLTRRRQLQKGSRRT